jgi:hypothetical protein
VLSLMAVERNAPVRVAYQLLIYPTCMAPPTPSAIEFADGTRLAPYHQLRSQQQQPLLPLMIRLVRLVAAYILPKWSSKFFKSQYLLGHDHAITAHHYLNPTKASFLDQSPHTHIVVGMVAKCLHSNRLCVVGTITHTHTQHTHTQHTQPNWTLCAMKARTLASS